MPSRIGKHDPATIVGVQNCCPERHHLALSPTAIRYVDIEVELLWVCRVRPLGRVEVISPLERQDRPVLDVQRHEGLARGPPRIRPVHLATQQSAIELGQLKRVRAVEDKALNASDHDVMMAHERPTALRRTQVWHELQAARKPSQQWSGLDPGVGRQPLTAVPPRLRRSGRLRC